MKTKNKLRYGAVRVTKGIHKGKLGYYDDDECGRPARAVVYFEEFLGGYHLIPTQYLENAETKFEKLRAVDLMWPNANQI